jgi:hypothetical protein
MTPVSAKIVWLDSPFLAFIFKLYPKVMNTVTIIHRKAENWLNKANLFKLYHRRILICLNLYVCRITIAALQPT